MRRLFGILACGALALCGCARPLPPRAPQATLYRDLERLVTVSETTGWYIDRVELNKLQTDTLLSVCAADPDTRQALLGWLDARIAAMGGPVQKAWRAHGKRRSAIKKLLTVWRIRMTLARAMKEAPEDCPFWIEPSPQFRGRQISDDRWQLTLGGGGKGIVLSQGGQTDLLFGGAGRLLLGRTFGDRVGLYFGGEAGASAAFPKKQDGTRGNLVVGIDMVAPVVVRYTLLNSYVEVEAGPMGSVNEEDRHLAPGFHGGLGFGGRATRKRWFFPGAVFGVSYERTYPRGAPAVQTIKIGLRVAVNIDL